MAQHGFDDLVITIDDDEGGTPLDISDAVISINGVSIEAVLEETHGAGNSWVEQSFTGLKRGADITLGLLFRDATPDVHATFLAGVGEQRSLSVTYGGAIADTLEVIIRSAQKVMARGTITKLNVVLAPTGTITEGA